ncbi:MAG: hypothetical protein M1820_004166 [Bogoriella megaspora]|nr:MAG: hypothetical protein M1820_004166 [Bogoriella megaspora]
MGTNRPLFLGAPRTSPERLALCLLQVAGPLMPGLDHRTLFEVSSENQTDDNRYYIRWWPPYPGFWYSQDAPYLYEHSHSEPDGGANGTSMGNCTAMIEDYNLKSVSSCGFALQAQDQDLGNRLFDTNEGNQQSSPSDRSETVG